MDEEGRRPGDGRQGPLKAGTELVFGDANFTELGIPHFWAGLLTVAAAIASVTSGTSRAQVRRAKLSAERTRRS